PLGGIESSASVGAALLEGCEGHAVQLSKTRPFHCDGPLPYRAFLCGQTCRFQSRDDVVDRRPRTGNGNRKTQALSCPDSSRQCLASSFVWLLSIERDLA